MALSEWGRWDDELDPVDLALLQGAYIRRKRFEARLIALEVMSALGSSLGGQPAGAHHHQARRGVSASGRPIALMSAEGLLAKMGAKIQ